MSYLLYILEGVNLIVKRKIIFIPIEKPIVDKSYTFAAK